MKIKIMSGSPTVFLMALVLSACLSTSAETRPTIDELQVESRILWSGREKSEPVFLPEALLMSEDVDDLPVDRFAKDVLRRELRKFNDERWRGRCNFAEDRLAVQGSDDRTISLGDYLERMPSVVLGTILRVEAGWDFRLSHVAEVAYVRIDEVLAERSESAAPATGSIVGVLFPGGRVFVSGIELCKDRRSGLYQPSRGQTILIGGKVSIDDSVHLRSQIVLPVIGNQVLAQPLPRLDAGESVKDLDSLRLRLRFSVDRERRRP